MQSSPQKRAFSRYAIISSVLAKAAAGMTIGGAISEVTKIPFLTHSGQLVYPKRRSIYRWIRDFKKNGIDSLQDSPRGGKTISNVLSSDFLTHLRKQKEADPDASIPDIIRRAEITKVIEKGEVSRSTAWRAATKMGLSIFMEKGPKSNHKRRFAYAHRMRMVLCDGKHFRAGVTRRKRVVLFYLDDATRKTLAAVVGPSESAELFLRGFMKVLRRCGKMVALYADRGPGFKADDVKTICGRLHIALIHGREHYPEGHGKIERFNQTALYDLLRTFEGDPSIDPSYGPLELRCEHYFNEVYNKRPHESLEDKTPDARWAEDSLDLDMPEDFEKIERHFIITEQRRVSRDNIVSVDGKNYEMPIGYAGKIVSIEHHLLDRTVSILHEKKMMRLSVVDLVGNASTRRSNKEPLSLEPKPIGIKTAARLAFDRDYDTIVGPAGDCFENQEIEE